MTLFCSLINARACPAFVRPNNAWCRMYWHWGINWLRSKNWLLFQRSSSQGSTSIRKLKLHFKGNTFKLKLHFKGNTSISFPSDLLGRTKVAGFKMNGAMFRQEDRAGREVCYKFSLFTLPKHHLWPVTSDQWIPWHSAAGIPCCCSPSTSPALPSPAQPSPVSGTRDNRIGNENLTT